MSGEPVSNIVDVTTAVKSFRDKKNTPKKPIKLTSHLPYLYLRIVQIIHHSYTLINYQLLPNIMIPYVRIFQLNIIHNRTKFIRAQDSSIKQLQVENCVLEHSFNNRMNGMIRNNQYLNIWIHTIL